MNTTDEYIPGICNINPQEVKRRRTVGIIGLAATVVVTVSLILLQTHPAFRAVIFIPGFIMATGFIQAKSKFCVGFASAGLQHTGSDSRKVENKAALALDKKRARKINIQALLIAIIVTVVALLLPI